jgi:amidase
VAFKLIRQTTAFIGIPAVFLTLSPQIAQAAVFRIEEATIADIDAAYDAGVLTSEQLTQLYLNRIEASEDSIRFPNLTEPLY